jgi:hypothetical protein
MEKILNTLYVVKAKCVGMRRKYNFNDEIISLALPPSIACMVHQVDQKIT